MALYLISTPLGNKSEWSTRARELTLSLPKVLCEDTRHVRRLLPELSQQNLVSYHQFNESQRQDQILQWLTEFDCGLLTDAGTPAICDPGARLVSTCLANSIALRSVGCLCAFAASYATSGWSEHSPLHFWGFFPRAQKLQEERIQECSYIPGVHAFYESPKRLKKTIDCIAQRKNGHIHLSKEISKIYENHWQGPCNDLSWAEEIVMEKGEWVVSWKPDCSNSSRAWREGTHLLKHLLSEGLKAKNACRIVAKTFELSTNELYSFLLEEKNN